MDKSQIPSPARSQGTPVTPRWSNPRRSRSLASPSRPNTTGRMSTVLDQFKQNNRISFRLSPLSKTILNDNTDIEEPRRNSWWKKIDNSRDISTTVGVLDEGRDREKAMETNVLNEEFDIEVLSQERKDYTIDLPESSGSESINSIVIPQRRLLNCIDNDNQPEIQKPKEKLHRFRESIDIPESSGTESIDSILIPQRKLLNYNDKNQPKNSKPKDMHQFTSKRESPGKHNQTDVYDKSETIGAKKLFNQKPKRTKPAFPAALLIMSPDKTLANKTKELVTEVVGQARNLFGNRAATKRKKMFTDFIVSESEDEISEIQPKLFAFNKVPEPLHRRVSTASRGMRDLSPSTSNTTDLEMEDWNLLPSSTMVDHQIEAMVAGTTPGKRTRLSDRLSKVSEAKESFSTGPKSNIITHSNSKSNKSASSKDNSNYLPDIAKKPEKDKSSEMEQTDTNTANQNTTLTITKVNASKIKSFSQKEVDEIIVTEGDKEMMNVDNEINIENEIDNIQYTETINIGKDQGIIETNRESRLVDHGDNDHNKIVEVPGPTEAFEEQAQDNEEDLILTYDENMQPEEADREKVEKYNNSKVEEQINVTGDEINEVLEELKSTTSDEVKEISVKETSHCEVNKIVPETDKEEENAQVFKENNDDNERSNHNLETTAKDMNEEIEASDQEDDMETDENNEMEESDNQEEASDKQVETDQQNFEDDEEQDYEDEMEQNDEEQVEEEEIVEMELEDDDNEVQSDGQEEEMEENEDVNESQEVSDDEESQEIEDQEILNESEEEANDEEEEEIDGHEENEDDETVEDVEQVHDEEIEEPHQISEAIEKTPDEPLHDMTNQADSFTAHRNTSNRKTSLPKNLSIKNSLISSDSTGFNDGDKNSSAEGSGWDSHRTTRKTLRQTFGRDFTPRKSLRALVMEKSAKRQTAINQANAKLNAPSANSTEIPGSAPQDDEIDCKDNAEMIHESNNHEMTPRTQKTKYNMLLEKMKMESIEFKQKMEEKVRNSLKQPSIGYINRPHQHASGRANAKRRTQPPAPKTNRIISNENLPPELLEDMKYRPPKRFQGRNASWISKRLYKFLESKLEPEYDYKARVRAEGVVETLYNFTCDIRKTHVAPAAAVARIKHEMARLQIVRTHFEFYEFIRDYLPRVIKHKIVPDIVNDIPLPPNGVYADILTGQVA